VRQCKAGMGKTFPSCLQQSPTFPCPFAPFPFMSRLPRGPRLRVTRPPWRPSRSHAVSPPSGPYPRRSSTANARRKRSEYASASKKSKSLRFNYGIFRAPARALREKSARPGRPPQETTCQTCLRIACDNISSALGFGPTVPVLRPTGPTMVNVTVNGRVVDIPSYQCRPGDPLIVVRDRKASPPNSLKATWNSPVWPTSLPIWSSTRTKLARQGECPDRAGKWGGRWKSTNCWWWGVLQPQGLILRGTFPLSSFACFSITPPLAGVFLMEGGPACQQPRMGYLCQLWFFTRGAGRRWALVEQTLIRWSSRWRRFSIQSAAS